jgi:hypothetical protein
VTQVATRDGHSAAEAARIASWATMLLAVGTILGCLGMPTLPTGSAGAVRSPGSTPRWPCRSRSVSVRVLPAERCVAGVHPLPVLCRRRGGSFAVYWVWLAEQYRTECRGSALAFASCIGRFVAAGATFLVGIGIQHYGSMGVPVALTAVPFAIGILLLPFGVETKGKPLPV